MYEKSSSMQLNTCSQPSNIPATAFPTTEKIRVNQSISPNYYSDPPTSTSFHAPAISCTRKGEKGLKYESLSESQKAEAKLKAHQEQHFSVNHPRLKGCTSSDLFWLLPGSWLSNFILNKYLCLVEEECKLIGNNVRTVNCDVFTTMKTPCLETFMRRGFDKLYGGILSCDVILGAVNFGNHWCLLATFPNSKQMVFSRFPIPSCFCYGGIYENAEFSRMGSTDAITKTTNPGLE